RLRRDDDIARQQVTRLKRRGDAGQSEVTSPKFYGSIFLRGPLPGWDPFDGAPGNDISKCVRGMMLGPAWESRAQGPRPPGFELSPQGDRRWNPRSGEVRRITVTTSRSRPHYRSCGLCGSGDSAGTGAEIRSSIQLLTDRPWIPHPWKRQGRITE